MKSHFDMVSLRVDPAADFAACESADIIQAYVAAGVDQFHGCDEPRQAGANDGNLLPGRSGLWDRIDTPHTLRKRHARSDRAHTGLVQGRWQSRTAARSTDGNGGPARRVQRERWCKRGAGHFWRG